MRSTKIEQDELKPLMEAGLFVSDPYPEGHGWQNGVRIGKPADVEGNSIPGFSASFITIGESNMPPKMDAPMIVLFKKDNKWVVHSQECTPDMGPGDFQNIWLTAEEATKDILDFFFGDPSRMQAKI